MLALILIIMVLLFSTHHFLIHRRLQPKLKLPPGPKPWPIIGNLNLMMMSSLKHRAIHNLSVEYGPLMQLQLGSNPAVVASSPDMARAFLQTNDSVFASRPFSSAGKYTAYNFSDLTFSPYGPYWRQARKIFHLELFQRKRLDSEEFIQIREEEMKSFMQRIYESRDPIPLRDQMSDMTLNVISRMVLGQKYTLVSSKGSFNDVIKAKELKEMVAEWFLLIGSPNIGDSIPQLGFLDLQGYVKRMKILAEKFDRLFELVLDEHIDKKMRQGSDFVARDMVDVLLQLVEDPNSYLDVKLERNGIKGFLLDIIAGGTQTSAVVAEWIMSELLRHPNILDKATAELDTVVGKHRWVQDHDITTLPYINAIMKETMRLHPPGAMIRHIFTQNTKIAGYDIPKGTIGMVNGWSLGRDPTIWDNPEKFWPERFVGKDMDVTGRHFELLPFGSGRRMCPGNGLGLKLIQTSVANILHGFAWELGDGMRKELDMEEMDGLLSPKKVRLVAIAKPRLAPHLYSD